MRATAAHLAERVADLLVEYQPAPQRERLALEPTPRADTDARAPDLESVERRDARERRPVRRALRALDRSEGVRVGVVGRAAVGRRVNAVRAAEIRIERAAALEALARRPPEAPVRPSVDQIMHIGDVARLRVTRAVVRLVDLERGAAAQRLRLRAVRRARHRIDHTDVAALGRAHPARRAGEM